MFSPFMRNLFIFALVMPMASFGSARSTSNGERDHAIMKETIRRMIQKDHCFGGDTSWLDTSPRDYNEQRNNAFNEYFAAIKNTHLQTGNALLIRKYKAEVELEWDQPDKDRAPQRSADTIVQPAVAKPASEMPASPDATPQASQVRPYSGTAKSVDLKYSKEVVPAIDWSQQKYKDHLLQELDAIKEVKYEHVPKPLNAKAVKRKQKNWLFELYKNNKVLIGASLGAASGLFQAYLYSKNTQQKPSVYASCALGGAVAGSAAGYFNVIPGAFVGANVGGIAGATVLEPQFGHEGDRQVPALVGGLIAGSIASATDTELPSALGAAGCVIWQYSQGYSQSVAASTAPVGTLMGTVAGYAGRAALRSGKNR